MSGNNNYTNHHRNENHSVQWTTGVCNLLIQRNNLQIAKEQCTRCFVENIAIATSLYR